MEKEIRLSLNSAFYRMECIKEAADQFADICSTEITPGNMVQITLHPKKEVDMLGEEFSNYVLGLMNRG